MTKKIDFFIDRFEGSFAVLLAGTVQIDFPRSLLPERVREGDYVTFLMEINEEKRRESGKEIDRLRRDLDRGT